MPLARLVETSSAAGQLWTSNRPEADERGCISIFTSTDLQRLMKAAPDGPAAMPAYSSMKFGPRGDVLASVDQRGSVYVYHLTQNRFSCVRRGGLPGTAMAFGTGTKQNELLIAVADGTILCYNVASGQLMSTLKGHRNPVRRISMHPSGGYMLSTSTDTTLLWDTRDWTKKRALGGGASGIVQAAFTPTGDSVVILFRDDTFMLWDFGSFTLRASLARPNHASLPTAKAEFTGFTLDADGRTLVSGGRGSPLVYVWDLEQRLLVRTIRMPAPCRAILDVSFLPDDKTVAALCDDGVLRFVDVAASRLLFDLGGIDRGAVVSAVALDPRGTYCATAGPDAALRLYDLAAARNAAPLVPVDFSRLSLPDRFPLAAAAAAVRQGAWSSDRSAATADAALVDSAVAGERTASRDSSMAPLRRSAPAASRSRSVERTEVGESREGAPAAGGPPTFEFNDDYRAWSTAPARSRGLKAPAKPAPHVSLELLKPALDRERLRKQVAAYGEFPAKYRLAVWQYLLALPRNQDAFGALAAKGPHTAFANLDEKLPISDRRLLARLQRALSRVAHWAPVTVELDYLPALAFPFVKLFDDEILALETTLTVLLNWGRPWLEHFPGAPAHVLDDLDRLLERHDGPLLAHFRAVSASRNAYGWALLKSLMTEVLSKADWLALWDNLLTEKPAFILFALVSLLKLLRGALMRLQRPEHIEDFLSRPQAVDIGRLVRGARAMWDRTESEHMPRAYQPPDFVPLPEDKNAYPALTRFPKFIADLAIAERERIRQDEDDLRRRRYIASSLKKKTAEMEEAERAWRDERSTLLAAEEERRHRLRVEEEQRLQERARLDAAAAEARLKQAEIVEQAYRRHVDEQRAFREAEIARLEDEIERRRARAQYEAKARLQAEAVAAVELEAWKRVQSMRAERERAMAEEDIRMAVAARNREAELREQLQEETWRREDEERRTRLQLAQEGRQRMEMTEEEARLKREVDTRARAEDLKRDIAVTQIERERRVRQMAEDEMMRLQAELADRRQEDEALRVEEDLHLRAIAEQDRRATAAQDEERHRLLEGEQQKAAAERALREERLRVLEREQRRREFEADYEEKRGPERERQLEEEFAVQRAVAALDEARRRERLFEDEMRLRGQALEEKHEFARKVREAEQRAAREERGKFDELRAKLWEKLAEEEREMKQRHELLMAKLAVAREKRLAAAEIKAMDRTQRSELRRLAQERGRRDVERGVSMAAYLDDEMRLRADVARGGGGGGGGGADESVADSVDAPPTSTTASPPAATDASSATSEAGETPARPAAPRPQPPAPEASEGSATPSSCDCDCGHAACCRRRGPSASSSPPTVDSPASSGSGAPCGCDCCRRRARARGRLSPDPALSTISEEEREARAAGDYGSESGESALEREVVRLHRELRAARGDRSTSPSPSTSPEPARRALAARAAPAAPLELTDSESSTPRPAADRVYVIRTAAPFNPDGILGLRDAVAGPALAASSSGTSAASTPAPAPPPARVPGASAAEAELDRIERDVQRLHGLVSRLSTGES